LADDEQARLSRLASVAAGTDVSRIIEQTILPDSVGRAVLGSRALQRELALASEGRSNLAFHKDLFGTAAMRDSVLGTFRHLEDLGGASYLRKVHLQHEELMKHFTGSLSVGLLARQKELLGPFSGMRAQMDELAKSLRGPDFRELMPEYHSITSQIARMAEPYNMASKQARELSEQLGGITKPWSTFGNETASIAAAMRLSQLATFSRELPAFSKDRATLKAIEFGGFDQVMPVAEALEDEDEGETVYTEAGRNPALVAFPSDGYGEILTATGWVFDIKPPEFIRPDGTPLAQAIINSHDHFIINMIEGHLKAQIAASLIAAGGTAAISRLFGNRIPDWERKRDDALRKGEAELHLIYYADFMEIAEIVSNKELWESTFRAVFRHKERFRMAIERLHGLRIPTSHSRPLTRTGRLRLLAEAIELFEAIGVMPTKH
jgi:hypothetical protein